MTTNPQAKMNATVGRHTTAQLLDLHRVALREMRDLPAGYRARRPHALVLLSIESELMRRGVEPPSRGAP